MRDFQSVSCFNFGCSVDTEMYLRGDHCVFINLKIFSSSEQNQIFVHHLCLDYFFCFTFFLYFFVSFFFFFLLNFFPKKKKNFFVANTELKKKQKSNRLKMAFLFFFLSLDSIKFLRIRFPIKIPVEDKIEFSLIAFRLVWVSCNLSAGIKFTKNFTQDDVPFFI